ncbi:hypothetical protein D3C85_1536700 [compost metagenome]
MRVKSLKCATSAAAPRLSPCNSRICARSISRAGKSVSIDRALVSTASAWAGSASLRLDAKDCARLMNTWTLALGWPMA